ncbi:non-specific serine/threonine protein kinase [Plasmodiophora brassicae]|uniref:non-specific serine/threonine protein kinase n=1 Tax=Plasmodiophora brassicae TaxID=37360 RepID=A0A0G4IMC0_PLABS|nr:hypothetical protein PBRA_005062 [Plasmodiophora brassicae]
MGQKGRSRAARKVSRDRDKEIQRRHEINEIQESEIELLSNMYMDDFSICDDDIDYDWPRGFAIRIRVSNEVQGDDRIYPSMTLSVRIPREYPNAVPRFSLDTVSGLSPDDQKLLAENLDLIARSKLGEVCVFDCINSALEFLHSHGTVVEESVHAEMQSRRAIALAEERARDKEVRSEIEEQERVRFQQRVAEEMTKKAAREELTKKSASVERLQKSAHDLLAKNVSRVDSEPVPVHHNHDDIFEMDDFELDRDNDTAADVESSWSSSSDSGKDEGNDGSSDDESSSPERGNVDDDDDLIALSFNEHIGTPMMAFMASRSKTVEPVHREVARTESRRLPEPKSAPHGNVGIREKPPTSRYRENFAELGVLGRGGFGQVVKARNIIDGIVFGIKKVPLPVRDSKARDRILREVTTIARLHHRYIVRYYSAWIESSSSSPAGTRSGDNSLRSAVGGAFAVSTQRHSAGDSVHDWMSGTAHEPDSDLSGAESSSDKETLYIQFEYCPNKTLREVIDEGGLSENMCWRILRQICEALEYIHSQGVVHRDIKPPNVFFDEHGDIKVGDFGLAVSHNHESSHDDLQLALHEKHSRSSGAAHADDSDKVGTPYYRSPEQESGRMISDKTDMFALGITLFEMFTSFSTLMERHIALSELRKTGSCAGVQVSRAKPFPKNVSDIIERLLKKDPSERPSSSELLRSGLIPTAEDDAQIQYALNALSNPVSTFRSRVVECLFQAPPDRAVDFTYELMGTPSKTLSVGTEKRQELPVTALNPTSMKIMSRIEEIFRLHGALHLPTPVLTPKVTVAKESNPVVLLDAFGVPVQLPHSLTVPFARMVAHRGITSVRRYDFSPVYRQSVCGGQPLESLVGAFDIVFPTTSSRRIQISYACELIRLLDECLSVLLPPSSRTVIYVNDLRILEAVLDHFVPSNAFPQARVAIESQLGRLWFTPWQQIRRSLIQDYHLSKEAAEALDFYATLRGPSGQSLSRIESALNAHGIGQIPTVRAALDALSALFRLIHAAGVTRKVHFHAAVVADWHIYRGGVVFQVVHEVGGSTNAVKSVAVGGRYDDLVARFRSPTSDAAPQSALGVSIALEALLAQANDQPSSYYADKSVLLFCNMNKLLDERFRVAALCWKNGFKAEYDVSIGDSNTGSSVSLSSLPRYCRLRHIRWLVVFRPSQYSSGMVKVFDIARHHQHGDKHAQGHSVELHNLIQYLQNASIRKSGHVFADKDPSMPSDQDLLNPVNTTNSPMVAAISSSSHANAHHSHHVLANPIVFIAESLSDQPLRGHARNQHIRTAGTLAGPLVVGFEANQYRIAGLMLPMEAIRSCVTLMYGGNGGLDAMRAHCNSSSVRHSWRRPLSAFCDWLEEQMETLRLTLRVVLVYSVDDRKLDLVQL